MNTPWPYLEKVLRKLCTFFGKEEYFEIKVFLDEGLCSSINKKRPRPQRRLTNKRTTQALSNI